MIEYLTKLFVSSLDFIMKAESFYLIESCLIIFGALLLDLSQRKTLASFKIKAEHTKTIWDDVVFGALARPISVIIWISAFSYMADIIQDATKNMLFYELFDPAREIGIILSIALFFIGLISKAEASLLMDSNGSDQTTIHALTKLGYMVVGITGLLTLLQTLGLSVSGLMAFGGMGGIAVGFAAQDVLANFLVAFLYIPIDLFLLVIGFVLQTVILRVQSKKLDGALHELRLSINGLYMYQIQFFPKFHLKIRLAWLTAESRKL